MLFEGVHVPLTTPFYPDGGVYYRKLEHNVRRYSLTPVQGLVVLTAIGESASLTTDEKRAVLKAAAETASPERVLTASIAEAGVMPALQLAEHAAKLEYDAVLLQAPFIDNAFWWRDDAPATELLMWFRSIADQSALPVLLASQVAGRDLPVETLAMLAEHPNIIGVIEQSTHIGRVADLKRATTHIRRSSVTTITFAAATSRMLAPAAASAPSASGLFVSAESLSGGAGVAVAPAPPALKTRTKETGFQVLWSNAKDAIEAMRAGAAGMVLDISAAVPQAVFEVWVAWKDGDVSLMQGKQLRVENAEPFFLQEQVAAIKAGAELSGYFGGRPRLPLLALPKVKQEHVATLLNGMRS